MFQSNLRPNYKNNYVQCPLNNFAIYVIYCALNYWHLHCSHYTTHMYVHYADFTLYTAHSTSGKSQKLPAQVTTMLAAGDSRGEVQCTMCIEQCTLYSLQFMV